MNFRRFGRSVQQAVQNVPFSHEGLSLCLNMQTALFLTDLEVNKQQLPDRQSSQPLSESLLNSLSALDHCHCTACYHHICALHVCKAL